MTTTALSVLLGCLAGAALSVLHFGGLWLTVQVLPTAQRPGLMIMGSVVARLGVSLMGFYLVLHFGWESLVASLAGFLTLRFVLLQL